MKRYQKEQESKAEIKRRRTESRNAVIVILMLLIALMVGSLAGGSQGEPAAGDIAWAVLSIIAFACVLWSLYTSYRQSDERQKLIQLQASSLAFMAVMFGVCIAQMLHALQAVSLTIATQVIFVGGILAWNVLLGAIERRNRL